VFVGCDGEIAGAISLGDTVRDSAAPAVAELESLGLRVILLTGDNETTARKVADLIGVDEVVAGALPTEKVDLIKSLQSAGRSVAMVGDGINDGPALAVADLGLAVGSGTDVAINAAGMVVVRDDLRVVPMGISLARKALGTIRGNLVWAFAYNVVAIPVAACGLLNPLIAGAAMVLSSSFVVWNSSRLARVPLTRGFGQLGNESGRIDGPDSGSKVVAPASLETDDGLEMALLSEGNGIGA
jgi:P-type Cu+ transporter